MMITFADMEGNESFDPSLLGTAEEVSKVDTAATEDRLDEAAQAKAALMAGPYFS